MSKLKGAFNRGGGIDSEIDKAFSSQAPASKPTVSERVLESQQKFNTQFQNRGKPVEILPKNDTGADFGRFDENFVPDTHLDNFDETKNIEDFSRLKPPQAPPPLRRDVVEQEFGDDRRELATATPRRNPPAANSSGDSARIIEELEDLRAQNSEILRRMQRIEEKLRKNA